MTVDIGGGADPQGELKVEGDPRVSFSDADRRARQSTLLALYELQKSLAIARATSAAARVAADTRLAQLQSEIAAELNTATVLSRAIKAARDCRPVTSGARSIGSATMPRRRSRR